ncbi:endonuclease-reverse transcriptase [Danaus plexippus plexippus]|uniref:Endonuclease-reverse transcriptase n=1 Tax=Danaus plexippus plexippus TaxID=278856 RepID=A0A212F0M3_DANPL|nr:endonuclease-reverse transcriptase [Danaus plexippus plexippus]
MCSDEHVVEHVVGSWRNRSETPGDGLYTSTIPPHQKEKSAIIITEWYPRESRRSRGRQLQPWEDDLKQVAGLEWLRTAKDRNKWKKRPLSKDKLLIEEISRVPRICLV